MKVVIRDGFIYEPTWNDNKEKPEEERIKIHFKFLSGQDFTEVIACEPKKRDLEEWLKMCVKVENLFVNDIAITPEGLYNMKGLMELFIECRTAYRLEGVITHEDKKKS